MRQEIKTAAFILKRQPLGEADELITFYSQQVGKIRAAAKAVKKIQSKLVYGLQSVGLLQITLSQSGTALPKIIHAQTVKSYHQILASHDKIKALYIVAELVLKSTADEEPNEHLFQCMADFFEAIDHVESAENEQSGYLTKFKISLLESIGSEPRLQVNSGDSIYFSNNYGGFSSERHGDGLPVTKQLYDSYILLKESGIKELKHLPDTSELGKILSGFFQYILEREIKSERH